MYRDFITQTHQATKRNYIERVVDHDKAQCAEVAGRVGQEYWDGDRRFGYGGFRYDGRWKKVAEMMVEAYGINAGDKILDVGCGKAFLLYVFTQVVPGVQVVGIDISEYGIKNSKEEVRENLMLANATKLPFKDKEFDFVYSINTLHNLHNYDLFAAVKEIERVGKTKKHITVESYRNESEKANLLYWQLTCKSFYTPKEWEWFFEQAKYTGDYGCIYFE
jgi:protein-L-isoaspartate(D-aspartate) O-methyltransferase